MSTDDRELVIPLTETSRDAMARSMSEFTDALPGYRRVQVPSAQEMTAMGDEELTALMADMRQACAQIETKITRAREAGTDTVGLRKALGYQRRGMLAADELLHRRFGSQTPYKAAQPVTDWVSGFHAIKAMNRLLGLAKAEHEALGRWISLDGVEADEAVEWRALCLAHDDLQRALAALPDLEGDDTRP